jgi:hypothetical protein
MCRKLGIGQTDLGGFLGTYGMGSPKFSVLLSYDPTSEEIEL